MRRNLSARLGIAVTVALLLGGCGGSGGAAGPVPQALPAQSSLLSLMPQAGRLPPAQLYVVADESSFGPATVLGYHANNKRDHKAFCNLAVSGGVNSISVDGSGTVWVPQGNGSIQGTIASFAPGCGAPGTTLVDPDGFPSEIAFSSKGVGYVSNIAGVNSSPASVSVYPIGATQPSRKLVDPAIIFGFGVALDSHDNVFMSYGASGFAAGGVFEFAHGKMPGKQLTGVVIVTPGLLQFDRHDNLVLVDQGNASVDIYAPPYTGNPTSFQLQGSTQQCSLNRAQTTLACADFSNAEVDVYAYPAGTFLYSFNNGLTHSSVNIGIAYDPSAAN